MKTVAICLARMGSTRLPGKVMKDLGGKPLLRWTVDALQHCPSIDEVVVATSWDGADDAIQTYCLKEKILCYRGSQHDVLDRFYNAAKANEADIVLRFTCDCCFIDPYVVEQVIKLREMTDADFASNCYPPTYPDGLDTECFTFAALETAWQEATSPIDRDCLTQFIVRNRRRFKVVNMTNPLPGGEQEHWVCDSPEDFDFCIAVAERLDRTRINGSYEQSHAPVTQNEILSILAKEPELRKINSKSIRNERFYESLGREELPVRTFDRSQRVFARASALIPTGANTFSKSHLQLPSGRSPLYASHGDGAYIFDVDGNRYVDLVNALHPVVLGYCDPDVDRAVRQRLDDGVTLSLTSPLEIELAEKLVGLIPCAEMVKFGKTGTDVTTAAVRLARAHTGRDHVFISGYSGWADWSMACTDRNHGIPEEIRNFTHSIPYGEDVYDTGSPALPWPHQVAAIIVEPTDNRIWLHRVREHCWRHGIVLIFDEVRTGFRYSLGGAQQLFGITPDLACFGKAMANGMPISALVGERTIMEKMETPDVFYSGTFFGETLSLAAAIATIDKLEREKVIPRLWNVGKYLSEQIEHIIQECTLQNVVKLDGLDCDKKVVFLGKHRDKVRSLFMETMFQQGVLIINGNTLSYAIREPEINRIITAYATTLQKISSAMHDGSIEHVWPTQAAPLRIAV